MPAELDRDELRSDPFDVESEPEVPEPLSIAPLPPATAAAVLEREGGAAPSEVTAAYQAAAGNARVEQALRAAPEESAPEETPPSEPPASPEGGPPGPETPAPAPATPAPAPAAPEGEPPVPIAPAAETTSLLPGGVAPTGGGPAGVLADLEDARPSSAAAAFADAVSASATALEAQRSDAAAALPQMPAPTGLPPAGGPPAAPAPGESPVGAPQLEVATAAATPQAVTVEEAPPIPPPPTVLAGGTAPEAGDTDVELTRSAQAALGDVSLPADQVDVSLGAPPGVDLSKDVDPGQLDEHAMRTSDAVAEARRHALAEAGRDFGENAVYPNPSSEVLGAPLPPGAPPPIAEVPMTPLALEPDVAAGLDASLGPVLHDRIAEQTNAYTTAEDRYQDDAAAAHSGAQSEVQALEDDARAQQVAERSRLQTEVGSLRGEWRSEVAATEEDFHKKTGAARAEHGAQIAEKRRRGEAEAAAHYERAEREAAEKRAAAEREAARKKKEAEEESDGFWGWVKSAAKALIDGLKAAVNFIYDNLRKAVKFVFETAKKLALAAIDLARSAIVGLIKAFGEVLKVFVDAVLVFFPDLARRINSKIDAAVNGAVDAVNAVADALKKGVAAVLDFLANAIDSLLGLIQDIYNGILTVIGMIVSGEFQELMAKLGNLVAAAQTVPDQFETAALEELLGGDLDKPLSPDELAAAGRTPPGVEEGPPGLVDAAALPAEPWTTENVGVDEVATGFELSPELSDELMSRGDGEVEVASSQDPARSMAAVVGEVAPESERAPGAEPVHPDDGLSPRERAGVRWQLMKDGIARWWDANWPYVIAGAAVAILGVIALLVVTGGAILGAIPPIMAVLGPLFTGVLIATLAGHVRDYVQKAWGGDVRGGGKSLAKGLAAGAIELISLITFKVAGAALKGAKAAARGAATAARAVGRAARGAASAATRGVKFVIARGKVLFSGLSKSALGRASRSIADFGARLLERLRFKKFRIVISGRRFRLEGYVNPWVLIADGQIEVVPEGTKGAIRVPADDLAAMRKRLDPVQTGRLKPTDVGPYDVSVSRGVKWDQITPDHSPSRASLVYRALHEKRLAAELRKGAKLTPRETSRIKLSSRELNKINQKGLTVAERFRVHKETRTLGGRNTPQKVAKDALDPAGAVGRDAEELFKALQAKNALTVDVVLGRIKLYRAHLDAGTFRREPWVDDMLMKWLKQARKGRR